jgi:soluble P-type ATPase
MILLEIPGRGRFELVRLLLDFNGTLAEDGRLLEGVAERLQALAERIEVVVVTADTGGDAARALAGLPLTLLPLAEGDEAEAKARHLPFGPGAVAAIGNGANDAYLLAGAALGLAVIQLEGASPATLAAADLVFTDVRHALDALLHPRRLIAGLRR